jgi:hypothetical protein
VFGRPDAAKAGDLFIVAGGPPDAIHLANPLFDVIGQRTFVVSETLARAPTTIFAGARRSCNGESSSPALAVSKRSLQA